MEDSGYRSPWENYSEDSGYAVLKAGGEFWRWKEDWSTCRRSSEIGRGAGSCARSSGKKDDHNKPQETQCGKQKTRPPHRFTKDELQILKQSFEENPYPTSTAREELANKLRCHFYVIDNWFQDKRCRLPPAEKKRIFAIRKLNGFHVQRSQSPASPGSRAQSDNSSTKQTSLHDQDTLLHRAGCSSLETQTIPSGHVSSGDSVVTDINREPRHPLEYQGAPASGPSSTCTPAKFIYPNTSVQYFESARYEPGESQHSLPFISHYVFTGQGTDQQQEEHKAYYLYMSPQGEQPNPWGYHLQQLSQPQYYQENHQLPFHDQFLAYQNPSDLGQQEPKLASEQQSNGGALSSLLQQAPVQIADRSPLPLGQGMQQVYAEISRSEVQHLENGVSPGVHC
ncbi:cytoplasmic polyadenylated homeobox-like protein [Erethizon dorsatum]